AGLYAFAESLTRLSERYLGVACESFVCSGCADDDERLMNDILHDRNSIFNKSVPAWRKRWWMVRNYWRGRWKFSAYSSTHATAYIFKLLASYVLDRNPEL
ncbi:MAG: hypothetical protein K2J51_02810, partial [Alistipes sp.]|nr:hypothetical protein [Alistipes sp.]